MAITLANALPSIGFGRNPILVNLLSDDYLESAGVNSVNALVVSGPVAVDDSILLKWNNIVLTLTAAADPGISDTLIPAGNGNAAYVQALADHLAVHYLIDLDFDVSVNGQQIVFTAKRPGSVYRFEPRTSDNLATILVTPGFPRTLKTNFAHHLEVWLRTRDAESFILAYSENVELDAPVTGGSVTDIGREIISPYLEADLPVLAGTAVTECTKSMAEYYIRYAQYFGTTATVKKLNKSAVASVAMGGLSYYHATQRNILTELCPDPNDETKNLFMRLGSRSKLVTAEQPEWLYFINIKPAPRTISVEARIYYSDESSLAFDIATGLVAKAYGKYQFPAGYTQVGIAGKAVGKMALYYTIRLKTATGYISAPYTYVLDYTWQEYPRYFVYLNAYGAFQTLATTGQGQQGAGRSKDTGRLDRSAGEIASAGEFVEFNIRLQDKGAVQIGYDRSTDRSTALLRDFFASTQVYLYQDGRLIPVGINTDSMSDTPDGVDVYAGGFEYYFLNEEERFTEAPGLADDDLNELLQLAGSPLAPLIPGDNANGGDNWDEIIDDPDFNDDEFYDDTE